VRLYEVNVPAPSSLDRTTAASEDLDLVVAVMRRDRKASARLVELYADPVYAYVHHRLLPRTDLVEDLVQDVFLAVLTNLAGFRGESSLRSWVLGIARHKVEDYYRSRLREPESALDEDQQGPAEAPPDPQLDESLDRERLQDKTRRVLESLPEEYSLALLWRYWEKRSAREIAACTGRTEKAVERLLARARQRFRRRWNDA